MTTTRDINKLLYNALNGDATLVSLGVTGVFDTEAPESQPLPFVVFAKANGQHTYVLSGKAWQTHAFDVRGISGTTKDLAERIDNRVAAILNLTEPAVDNGVVMDMRRTVDISYAERSAGTTFYHVGGTYEVMVRDV